MLTIVVLIVIGYLGIKLIPAYWEDRAVVTAMQSVVKQGGVLQKTDNEIAKQLQTAASFQGLDNIDFAKALNTRVVDGQKQLRVHYRVNVPLFGNIAAQLDFDHTHVSK